MDISNCSSYRWELYFKCLTCSWNTSQCVFLNFLKNLQSPFTFTDQSSTSFCWEPLILPNSSHLSSPCKFLLQVKLGFNQPHKILPFANILLFTSVLAVLVLKFLHYSTYMIGYTFCLTPLPLRNVYENSSKIMRKLLLKDGSYHHDGVRSDYFLCIVYL